MRHQFPLLLCALFCAVTMAAIGGTEANAEWFRYRREYGRRTATAVDDSSSSSSSSSSEESSPAADGAATSNSNNNEAPPILTTETPAEARPAALKALIQKGYRDWKAFKARFSKHYASADEERQRMLNYLMNQQVWRRHNEKYERREVTYKMGESWLSDLSFEEYRKLNGWRRELRAGGANATIRFMAPANVDVPEQWDWRDQGYVTEVKNQGMCGSCWAFSATGSLEGQHKRSVGELVSLSEQNLIDCSGEFGNLGCNGGLMDNAFRYIKENGGVDKENLYPYKGKDQKCHFKRADVGADDKGFADLTSGDEDALKNAVATVGPISVAIDAGHMSFAHYQGKGVYYEKKCSSEDLDHGVLVVGYGTDPEGGDYWIVKNSWGPKWGKEGYIYMARNRNNHCGIASSASYPLV